MPKQSMTSGPPGYTIDAGGDTLVADLVQSSTVAAFVPTLIEIARAVERNGHRAELRFRRDVHGRIRADGVEVRAVPNQTSLRTVSIFCGRCLDELRVNVRIDPPMHTCRCATPCPPERRTWQPANEAICASCMAVYPTDVLALDGTLDDAVQRGDKARDDWNPRYVAYSLEHGRDPQQMLAHDREIFAGGVMAGYIIWIGHRWTEWRALEQLDRHAPLSRADHQRFDAWLVARATP